MKTKRIIAGAALLSFTLFFEIHAQPFRHFALTSGEVNAVNCDTAGVSEGPSGADVIWTISPTPHDSQQLTDDAVLPSSTPYTASFPSATNATLGKGKNTAYTYYRVAKDSLFTLGYADSIITVAYSKPELSALSSLVYGNSFSSTYEYSETTAVSTEKFVSKVDVMRTETFDGTGTLVLPWKTFLKAMRFKAVSSQTDSSWLGTILTSVVKTTMTSFSWIDTTLPDRTGFAITRTTAQTGTISQTSMVVSYTEPVLSAVRQSLTNYPDRTSAVFVIWPIGKSNKVMIRAFSQTHNLLFNAYSMGGRTMASVLCEPSAEGLITGQLHTSLPRGIYAYSLMAGGELVATGKVQVR
jgi:hypothetical protein